MSIESDITCGELPSVHIPSHDCETFDPQPLLARLRKSRFRARFHLDQAARDYVSARGMPTVMAHGADFIRGRLAPAHPARDGKQTPMRGHPIFIAQHATGSCCRSCLAKWHDIAKGVAMTESEQERVLCTLQAWLECEDVEVNAQRQGVLF